MTSESQKKQTNSVVEKELDKKKDIKTTKEVLNLYDMNQDILYFRD